MATIQRQLHADNYATSGGSIIWVEDREQMLRMCPTEREHGHLWVLTLLTIQPYNITITILLHLHTYGFLWCLV